MKMQYAEFVEVYEKLSATTKRLEKSSILAEFMKVLKQKGRSEWAYLLNGRVVPDYDPAEFGISRQIAIKAIAQAFGISISDIENRFKKIGDLGEIAEEFAEKKKQKTLFSRKLTVDIVFNNLKKIMAVEGKGAIERKLALISELLGAASGKEAKYIIRTVLSDLRIGVAEGVLREALTKAFLPNVENNIEKIENAYDLANDIALIFESASKGERELEKIDVEPGRPAKVMLAVKAEDIADAFRICGKPAAIEYKYDGFRVLINKKGKEITLFTRKLENVTKQFPDVVEAVKKHVKGESFILDSEVVGYNPKTGKYMPFEAISQRIKRKYEIGNLMKELPVEANIFDVLYYNGKSHLSAPFSERRKIVERIIEKKEKVIRPSMQIVTDNEKEAMAFYENALKEGEEGIMVKKLDAPYKQGRRVGYIVKLKPAVNDFDLVIVGAEYGSGKRGGWLTSYIVACHDGEKFLEIGKVSSGLKEKGEEGTTYDEMTKLLKPLIIEEKGNEVKIKPKIVVSVTYQNIQESTSYSSGYALRFPRITNYRPDRKTDDIATLDDIKKAVKKSGK